MFIEISLVHEIQPQTAEHHVNNLLATSKEYIFRISITFAISAPVSGIISM